ncbi:MAG: 5'-nucleotidase C-terminal domain-containing protein [Prevotella sp.]|nr:5'-nucleotidase C-terminal domain-containing protein [Prevotella sp.]
MRKIQLFTAALPLLLLASCAPKHYQLVGVERTRLIVDSRYDSQPDQVVTDFMAPYKRVNDSIMAPVMGRVAHNMHAQRPESDLSNLVSDILVWAAKDYNEEPVLGIYNMGGIRADLTKGDVTYEHVLSVAPFENKICFVTLSGEQLMQLFREIAARGGEGVSKGCELVITKADIGGELVSARLHGKEIDPKADYRITTINYLLEGNDGLATFPLGKDKVAPDDPSNNSRFLIMNYFRDKMARGEVVDAKVEGRIKVKK